MRFSEANGTAVAAVLTAAVAAGVGLFLWARERELAGEQSAEEEVEAHPS